MPVVGGKLVELVEKALSDGKSWSEIADIVRRELRIDLTPEELKRVYEYAKKNQESKSAGGGPSFHYQPVEVGNLEDEVLFIYSFAKSRLLALKNLEGEIGAPVPETDRVLSTAIGALKLIAELRSHRNEAEPYLEVVKRVLAGVVDDDNTGSGEGD